MGKNDTNKFVSMLQQNEQEPTEEEKQRISEASLSICNNLAAVYVKQGKHKQAVEFSTKVSKLYIKWNYLIMFFFKALDIDPTNVKALFRRGKSYIAINEVEKAEQDLETAFQLSESDNAIKKELLRLQNKKAQLEKKQKQFYSKCLGGD